MSSSESEKAKALFYQMNQMIWMIFTKNIEEYNPNKKRKTLIVFDDIIVYILSNKKRNPVVT